MSQSKNSERLIPVYQVMDEVSTYHFVMLSVMMELNMKLIALNTRPYRVQRLETIQELLNKIEQSYEGYLPDSYMNRAKKFVLMMHKDLESLLKDINTIKR